MKFATKLIRHYPPHIRRVATLPWGKISIFFAAVEENANRLHFLTAS